ncbi:forkhead box protein P2-like isoform X1 [Erpetoichthys calabaricus]|uniref:forkhead box protein P2-like isoform X1 n=2 Tax=Erpetoichthys calabaricus TaxID=27687 RepID=UPI0010A00CCB|nr:forkhead box protein P2-like isoform X1 [Erpetoichthys calabaricus]XP_051789465.1 forkhead box protein P2-like isoform X1 [Erpetoichthys calabaricus]
MPGSQSPQNNLSSSGVQQHNEGGDIVSNPGEPNTTDNTPAQPVRQVSFPVVMATSQGNFMSLSPRQAIILQQLTQQRPSVLRGGGRLNLPFCSLPGGTSSLPSPWPESNTSQPSESSLCKTEAGVSRNTSSPSQSTSARSSPLLRRHSPPNGHTVAQTAKTQSSSQKIPEAPNTLFVNRMCKWPGCEEVFEEYGQFLKHLYRDHSPDEKSLAQWRVQREVVLQLQNQLTIERQRLHAMQLHLQFAEHRLSATANKIWEASEMDFSAHGFTFILSQTHLHEGSQEAAVEFSKIGHGNLPSTSLLPEMVPAEYYKYSNIRPPYTYASLIRWAILESPEKQLTLNEIYHWFMKMFAFFRYNTATWKNAVRHNLSLHKCFVRVEGGKGAVWTVDEAEFQRRRGQKFNRDQDVHWVGPYAHLCPQEPWKVGQPNSS